jgi:excinuclease ABC subunit C
MTGKDVFSALSAAEEGESLETFITVYYNPGRPPPPDIFLGPGPEVPAPGEAAPPDLKRWFREQFGYEPALSFTGEKHHAAILAMARQNALEELRRRIRERGAGPGLEELAGALGLRGRPERIEGFDIAQLGGKHPVASLISFRNGVPDRKNYRYFKLRTVVGVVDDFAAVREAVRRRYSRLIREGRELPDLVLIDGGIGQVNAARGVMDELGMDIDVVGLAKRDEELWLPGAKGPVILSRRSEALKILQFVRDETHRFATGLNQRLRSGDLAFPALESVEGIGPKRAAAIMDAYGGIEGIAAADPAELAERCGIGRAAAGTVRAAARLALEDRKTAKARLAASRDRGGAGTGGSLAAEAAADYGAEDDPDDGGGPPGG